MKSPLHPFSAVRAVLQASSALLTSHDLQILLPGILDAAKSFLTADAYAVWQLNRTADAWQIAAAYGLSENYRKKGIPASLPHPIPLDASGNLLPTPLIFDNVIVDTRLMDRREIMVEEGIRSMAVFPLIVNGVSDGTIGFYFRSLHTFTTEEIEWAQALANLAGAAIANAQLFAAEKAANERAALLAKISGIFSSSLEFEVTMQSVVDTLAPALADWCVISLYDGTQLDRVAIAHRDPEKLRTAKELTLKYPTDLEDPRNLYAIAIRTLEPVLVTELSDETLVSAARDPEHLALLRAVELDSILLVPFVLGGLASGVLTLVSSSARPSLNDDDVKFCTQVADRAAVAIENARLYREQRSIAEQFKRLNNVSQKLAAELDQEKLLQSITDAATQGIGAEIGAFFYTVEDEAGGSLMLYSLSGIDRSAFKNFPMPRNTDIFGPTFSGQGPVRSDDITKDSRYGHSAPYHGMPHGHFPVRSYLALPVKNGAGIVIGGLFLGHSAAAMFSAEHESFVEALASQAAVALHNSNLYQQARRERQKAEEEIARRTETEITLNRERQFLTLAQKAGNIGSWELDLSVSPVVAVWSDELKLMYGIDLKSFVPIYDTWIRALHPEDREASVQSVQKAIDERRQWYAEFRIVRPDGSVRWMAGRGQPFLNDQGQPVRMIGVNIDVTDRKKSEATLLRSEKLVAAGRLAATVAHEINNPLEAATNLLFLAQSSATPEVAKYLESADQELRRVAHIARQTLGFYKENQSPRQFELGAEVEQVLSLLSTQLTNRSVTARLRLRPVSFTGVQGEMRQVISNLISNAADASQQGSKIQIRVGPAWLRNETSAFENNGNARAHDHVPAVRLTIADSGHGMSTHTMRQIFEPFFTTKKDVGNGLGLWVLSCGIMDGCRFTARWVREL